MKHSYQTRRLVALRDLRHDGQTVAPGGEVFATETDARYLIRTGHAADPEFPPAAPAAAPRGPASTPRRGPGRPPKTEVVQRMPSPGSYAPSPPPAPEGAGTDAGSGEQKTDTGAPEGDGSSESGDQTAG